MSKRKSAPAAPANDAAAQPAPEAPEVPELAPVAVVTPEPSPAAEQPRPACGCNCDHHHGARHFHALCEYFGREPANLEIAAVDPRVVQAQAKLDAAIARNDIARNLYTLRLALLHAKVEAAFPIGSEHFSEQQVHDLRCNHVHLHPHKPAA